MKLLFFILMLMTLLVLPPVLKAQDEGEVVADDEMQEGDEGEEAVEGPDYYFSVADWQNLAESSKTNMVLGIYMGTVVGESMLDGSVTRAGSAEKRKLRRYLLDGWGSSPDTFVEEINAIIDEDTYRISSAFIRAEANFAMKIDENNRAVMLVDFAKILERYYPPEKDKGLIGCDVDTVDSWNSAVEAGEEKNFAIGFLNGIDTVRLYADSGERVPFTFRVGQYVTEMNKISKTYAGENETDLGVAHLMLLSHVKLNNRVKKK